MLMHRDLNAPGGEDNNPILVAAPFLKTETFTPLSQRLDPGQPVISEGLKRLKKLLSTADFERYIESLIALRLQEETVWLITDREMHRSLLERDFLPQLRAAFGVKGIRVLVSQA